MKQFATGFNRFVGIHVYLWVTLGGKPTKKKQSIMKSLEVLNVRIFVKIVLVDSPLIHICKKVPSVCTKSRFKKPCSCLKAAGHEK